MTSQRPATPRSSGRRALLVLGLAAGAVLTLPRLWRALIPAPALAPHPDVPGFRMLQSGAVSARADPFAGIALPGEDRIAPVVPADLCAALYPVRPLPGAVPVAFFTDINCPYCRVMAEWLTDIPPTLAAVNWHDLPLLGDGSLAGARAIGAAARQGGAAALRARLNRTRFKADPAYLTSLSQSLGLDPVALLADMTGPEVTDGIAQSLGLAQIFGIPGTPAVVVGGTLAIGQMPRDAFEALLAREAAAPQHWPCRG